MEGKRFQVVMKVPEPERFSVIEDFDSELEAHKFKNKVNKEENLKAFVADQGAINDMANKILKTFGSDKRV